MSDGQALICTCKCGGIVFAAVLGHGRDQEHVREAAKLVQKGFAMRSPVPTAEVRAGPWCEHRGACTTGKWPKKKEKSQQVEAAL